MIGRVAVGAVGIAGVVVLTACSSSAPTSHDPSTPAPTASPASPAAPAGQGGAAGFRGPAASGTVAAVSGQTMQVQNPQVGQVAVTWTSSTKFTHQVTTTLAGIKAGDCVTALAPSGTSFTATSFTATSLMVSTGSTCTFGGGRRPAGLPSGFPSGSRPSGFPSGARPSGFPSGRGRIGAIATGKVTSISGNTLTIAARQFGPSGSGNTNKTVTVTSSTKITTDATTNAASVKVGKCVTAEGKADSTGAVTATQVRITDPVNGQCGTFRRFGGGGG